MCLSGHVTVWLHGLVAARPLGHIVNTTLDHTPQMAMVRAGGIPEGIRIDVPPAQVLLNFVRQPTQHRACCVL